MRLSELIQKELVGIEDGKKYGLLHHAELVLDPNTGSLAGIEVKTPKSWKVKKQDVLFFIPWNHIQVIGDVAVSPNDALGLNGTTVMNLLRTKHLYFVPLGQDDPYKKPTSLVADFTKIAETVEAAIQGNQLLPLLISYL